MGGSAKPKVLLLAKPLELQYYFAAFEKGSEVKSVSTMQQTCTKGHPAKFEGNTGKIYTNSNYAWTAVNLPILSVHRRAGVDPGFRP